MRTFVLRLLISSAILVALLITAALIYWNAWAGVTIAALMFTVLLEQIDRRAQVRVTLPRFDLPRASGPPTA